MSDVTDLKAEVLLLRKENAKLRGERDMYRYLASWMVHPNIPNQLRAENAKLRELVANAHACKENDGCCEDCYADEGDCPIEQRMRELGVEVTQ